MSESTEIPARRAADSQRDRASDRERILRLLFTAILVFSLGALGWWSWQHFTTGGMVRDGAPNWLPDSQHLIFQAEIDGQADLFVATLTGADRQPVQTGAGDQIGAAYTQDGTAIAFASDREGNFDIYKMLGNFSTAVPLTRDPGRDMAPAWAPDGSFLVFMSNRSNAEFDLFKMNADGTGVEQLTRGGANGDPQVSPDGISVAYQNGRDVHVLNLRTRQTRRVTYEPLNGMHPTWSPDGLRLAFMTWRNGRTEIFTSKADGSNQELLVRMPSGDAVDPRWSPNGEYIAFVHVTGGPEASAQQRVIFVVDVNSKRLSRVSR